MGLKAISLKVDEGGGMFEAGFGRGQLESGRKVGFKAVRVLVSKRQAEGKVDESVGDKCWSPSERRWSEEGVKSYWL